MPTAADVIVNTLTNSKALMQRYVEDLKPDEFLHRPTPKSNCVAWLIGHLVLTDRRIMTNALSVTDLPSLPEGFEKRFSRDEGCPQAADFGDVSILMPLFVKHRDLMVEKVKSATPEALSRELEKKHPLFGTAWEAVNFMGLHVAMHAGQITIIRRSLGRPPIV